MVNKILFMIAFVFSASVLADNKQTFEDLCLSKKDYYFPDTGQIITSRQSCTIAGEEILIGRAVTKDRNKAFRYFKMACDGPNPNESNVDAPEIKSRAEGLSVAVSCLYLGSIYYCGDSEIPGMWGVEMGGVSSKYNRDQALKYFSKACDLVPGPGFCDFKTLVMNNERCPGEWLKLFSF